MESCINGKCYCEIDGSKKININKERRLMFGIYDRGITVYVMQITTEQENHYYLSLKIMYIRTFIQQKIIRYPNEEFYPTRIFQDCFLCYPTRDFKNLDIILKVYGVD